MKAYEEPHKYIERLRSQGVSDDVIYTRLQLAGWDPDELTHALWPTEAQAVPTQTVPIAGPQKKRLFTRRRFRFATAFVGAILFAASGGATAYYFNEPHVVYSLSIPQPSSPTEEVVLNYGALPALSDPEYYAKMVAQLSAQQASFITADLSTMELHVYVDGVQTLDVPILSKGKPGSWWETPVGVYEIRSRETNHFSSLGQVYMPWSLAFEGNFFIHGWPYHSDGTPVEQSYSGGCIRLSDEDAERVYEYTTVGMPVLVYETPAETDDFTYRPKGPTLSGTHSLAVDVKNGSVVAGVSEQQAVPIASITKLMTALVATEYLDLDRVVRVPESANVENAVYRLDTGDRLSVYDLLILMLTESSNEAAETLASALGRDTFIKRMNEKAKAINLTHTTFDDPSGLSKDNTSTMTDLFLLLQYLYENRRFILDITSGSLDTGIYGKPAFNDLQNFNLIAGDGHEFVGGKIGNTDEAHQTYAGIFMLPVGDEEERPIATIVLGSNQIRKDIRDLLNYVDRLYVSE